MGRMANPQEVADSVVYLSSERASYITGSILSVSLSMISDSLLGDY
jgi:NAD(P)-dependent dehydrogenase (short-subunit alcohol dehydrogenase family)